LDRKDRLPILKEFLEEHDVKHLICNRITLVLAVVAIALVGMLHDPDLAKGDDLQAGPVAHEYLPGYQCDPDATQAQPLTRAEAATLNASADIAYATF